MRSQLVVSDTSDEFSQRRPQQERTVDFRSIGSDVSARKSERSACGGGYNNQHLSQDTMMGRQGSAFQAAGSGGGFGVQQQGARVDMVQSSQPVVGKDQTTKIKLLMNDLQMRDQQIDILNEQVGEFEHQKRDWTKSMRMFEEQRAEQQKGISEMRRIMRGENENNSKIIHGLTEKQKELAHRNEDIEGDNYQLRARITELTQTIDQKEAEISLGRAVSAKYEAEKKKLIGEFAQVKEILSGIQSSASQGRDELNAMANTNENLHSELLKDRTEISRLESICEKHRVKADSDQKKLLKQAEKLVELEELNARLEKRSTDFTRISQENAQLRVDEKHLKSRIDDSQKLLDEAKTQLLRVEQTSERQAKESSKLVKKQLGEVKKTQDALVAENTEMQQKLTETINRLGEFKEILENLTAVAVKAIKKVSLDQRKGVVGVEGLNNLIVLSNKRERTYSVSSNHNTLMNHLSCQSPPPAQAPSAPPSQFSNSTILSNLCQPTDDRQLIIEETISVLTNLVELQLKQLSEMAETILQTKQSEEDLLRQIDQQEIKMKQQINLAQNEQNQLLEAQLKDVTDQLNSSMKGVSEVFGRFIVSQARDNIPTNARRKQRAVEQRTLSRFIWYFLALRETIKDKQSQQKKPNKKKNKFRRAALAAVFLAKLRLIKKRITDDTTSTIHIQSEELERKIISEQLHRSFQNIMLSSGEQQESQTYLLDRVREISGKYSEKLMNQHNRLTSRVQHALLQQLPFTASQRDSMFIHRLSETNDTYSVELQRMSHRVTALGESARREVADMHKQFEEESRAKDEVISKLKREFQEKEQMQQQQVDQRQKNSQREVFSRRTDQECKKHNEETEEESNNSSTHTFTPASSAASNRPHNTTILTNETGESKKSASLLSHHNPSYYQHHHLQHDSLQQQPLSMNSLQHELSSIILKKRLVSELANHSAILGSHSQSNNISSSSAASLANTSITSTKIPGKIVSNKPAVTGATNLIKPHSISGLSSFTRQ